MTTHYEGRLLGQSFRVAIAVSRFNDLVTERLLDGALDALRRHGIDEGSVSVVHAPGAFELPLVAQRLASSEQFDAIICLGAIIRGATGHYDHVAAGATSGIAKVALDHDLPVIFGVLTTDNTEQALERAGIKAGNKGFEAAVTAIEMVDLMNQLPKAAV